LTATRFSMFSDRRKSRSRRSQDLSMPKTLNRRADDDRRQKAFQAKPWWLSIGYCEELVSTKELPHNDGPKTESEKDGSL